MLRFMTHKYINLSVVLHKYYKNMLIMKMYNNYYKIINKSRNKKKFKINNKKQKKMMMMILKMRHYNLYQKIYKMSYNQDVNYKIK